MLEKNSNRLASRFGLFKYLIIKLLSVSNILLKFATCHQTKTDGGENCIVAMRSAENMSRGFVRKFVAFFVIFRQIANMAKKLFLSLSRLLRQ